MSMNRVQFQKGLSMPEFLQRCGTEEHCEQALGAARWPAGYACPACGHAHARTTFVRPGRRYWQCAGCQHRSSVTSGTVFDSTKLPLTIWFLAMQLLTQAKNNVPALELKRQIGVCCRTAWLLKHKVLEAMRLAESGRQLTGRVEIDDACLGGQRSGGKAGRGSENKVPFVAAIQTTEDGRPHLACLSPPTFTKASLEEFFARSTVLPLTAVPDGLSCFAVATSLGAVHDREVTGGGKASVALEKFRCVNTLIGNLKTALTGTCHAIKFAKYVYRYLAEVQFRFNHMPAIFGGLGACANGRFGAVSSKLLMSPMGRQEPFDIPPESRQPIVAIWRSPDRSAIGRSLQLGEGPLSPRRLCARRSMSTQQSGAMRTRPFAADA